MSDAANPPPGTVLLIEDDTSLRTVWAGELEHMGFEVVTRPDLRSILAHKETRWWHFLGPFSGRRVPVDTARV